MTYKEADRLINEHLLDIKKLREKQLRLTEAVGAVNAIEVNIWIFIMENMVYTFKHTEGYNPNAVTLLKETYGIENTVYKGSTEECRTMFERIMEECGRKPDE